MYRFQAAGLGNPGFQAVHWISHWIIPDGDYSLVGVIIVSTVYKYWGVEWSAHTKKPLTVAAVLTTNTPETVVGRVPASRRPGDDQGG